MQSCSIHHCVLLLLTLTFTTAPVADAVIPIEAKLHQRVTLPCKKDCDPGEAKWTLYDTRSVVFARCDQTSCSSVVKGYEMSRDQYLKGDLSLTITSAEYSMRNTYVCECGTSDYSTVRLIIETVFSAVQVKHDGDLILDLTVPEPVEVIYTSSDSADGEQICNVTQHSLQCKAEYTHRTSLSYPEFTLRDVMYSDSGRYTIWDTENKEDIRVYAVSVTGLTKGMTALIVLLVLVVVLVISGVIIYKWREAEKKRRAAEKKRRAAEEEEFIKVDNEMKAVCEKITELLLFVRDYKRRDRIEKIEEVEKMIDDLEQRYRENSKYSDRVTLFCDKRRREVILCRRLYEKTQKDSPLSESEQDVVVSTAQLNNMMGMMIEVLNYFNSLSDMADTTRPINVMLVQHVEERLKNIESWCKERRKHLDIFTKEHGDEANVKLMSDIMEALVSVYEMWCEDKEKELEKYKYPSHKSQTKPRSENQSESEPLNRNV